MTRTISHKVRAWLPGPLDSEVARNIERLAQIDDIERIALMPDVHLAEGVSVGTVIASRCGVYPDAVGGDIGCGMLAIRLNAPVSALANNNAAHKLLFEFSKAVPTHKWPVRQPLPGGTVETCSPSIRPVLERDGAVELGTLGRGNHFLEIDTDDEDELWLLLHSGSRAVGPAVRNHHRQVAVGMGPVLGSRALPGLCADSIEGIAYLEDQRVALSYADANREAILARSLTVLADVLGASPATESAIRIVHNFVRRETVDSRELFVHRKGAISARSGEFGIIPGSMGTHNYLVEGRGVADALNSSSHGAGRIMSRTEAARRIHPRKFEREMAGITYQVENSRLLRDEAPSAYKPIAAVMRAQRELTRITARLRPVLVYKGI
jgi:tRNA-splicing ligase RtcB (3'-phosphate/5'-hydroxy nucleic acid ligase)